MGNAQNKPVKEKKTKKDKSDRKSKQTASIDVTESKEEKPIVKETISADTTINFTYEDSKPKSNDPNEYVIGGYKVLRTLGKGSFGEVYLVILKEEEKNPNATQYALKKMFSPDTQSAQAPIQEAEILKTLKHINVVQYNDLFVHFEEGSAFMCLVMEFIDGGTLTEFATQSWEDSSKWNTEVVIRWLFKLLEGIEYVHSMKVVHRDLKPDNLFITFDKKSNELQLKIADFGVSTSNVSKKGQPDISGTPVFMAPEQITYGMFDIKVDMWAIGVILYQVALKLVAIPFIMAQETMDNRLRHINTIEDPSIRYLATMLLKHKSDQRPTAKSLLSHPLIVAWKNLLSSSKNEKIEDLVSILAYISGLTSASEEVAEKSFTILQSYPIESLVQVVKEYKCSGPLLKYLTLEKPQNRKDFVFNLLYQFSEQDVMNRAALRNENAVKILAELYKSSKNKQLLQLIASMCKTNLRNQRLFERIGMLPIIREYVKNNFQVEPQLSAQLVASFVNLNDADLIDKVKGIISKNPDLLVLFSTMRNSHSILTSSLFPSLLNLLQSHRDALTVLRYLLTDVNLAMISSYEKTFCSGDITKCCDYAQESWQCTTCWPKTSSSLCLFCAKNCHKGHTLIYTEEKAFSCDCYFFNCTIKKDRGNTPEFLNLATEANTYDSVTFPRKEDSTVNEISPLVFQPTNDITYSIQSDKPLSADGIGNVNSTVTYFEMTVTKSNKGPSEVFLGLAPEFYPTNSFPGEVAGTVGYYGYTGKRYCGETDGDFYGPKFGEGDTIGVGITNHGDVYFTRNGLYLGTATTIKKNTNYFITIAFRSKEIQVECNYKNTFVFDFEKKQYDVKYVKEVQDEVNRNVMEELLKKGESKRERIAALVTLKAAINEKNVEIVKELMKEEDPISQLNSKIQMLIDEETAKSKTELEQIKKESQKGKGFQDLDLDVKTIVKPKEPEPSKLTPPTSPAPQPQTESPIVAKKEQDDLDFLMNPVSIPMPKLAPIAKVEATSTPLPPIVATPTQDEVKLAEQLSEIDKLLKFE